MNTSLNILLLNYEFPPLGGGAGNATYYLLKEFSKDPQLRIDLITSSTDDFKTEQFSSNILIHYIDINKKNSLHFQTLRELFFYTFKGYFYARSLVKKNQFDLIHAFFGIPGGLMAKWLQLPYIVSLRGSDVPFYNQRFSLLDRYLFRPLSKNIWKNAAKITALSEHLKTLAHKTDPSTSIEIIRNGIDCNEFSSEFRTPSESPPCKLLFVGRFIKRKGIYYLLKAVDILVKKNREIQCDLIGEGPLLPKYKKWVEQKKLQDYITFHGYIPHEKLPYYYQQADIFILPSLKEALANVTQEALASGLVLITTDTGAAELLNDNGFVVPEKSSEKIAETIAKLISSPTLYQKMAKKSRSIALKQSWEQIAKKYKQIYLEIKNENR